MVMIFFVQLNNANTLHFSKILERLFCSKINWSSPKDINYETFIKTAVRDGPFDIQGGGGLGLGFF